MLNQTMTMAAIFTSLLLLVQDPPTPDLLQVNPGLAIWTLIAFGLVVFLLGRFAWPAVAGALEEREDTIRESMERAEKALAEAKQIQSDNAKARREAEQEAQRLLREAREAADLLRSEEIEKTRAQVRQLQEQARVEIENEKQSALETLRSEVADLAIQAAGKILHENLDADRQRRLVDRFIDELPKN